MSEAVEAVEREFRKLRPLWLRVTHWVGVALVSFALLGGLFLWALDTGPGRRFLADRIGALRPDSGLRVQVGRIDGSIYSRATLRDLRFYDRTGLFLDVPELKLDWRPTGWFSNRLDIRSLSTDLAILYRLPDLKEGEGKARLPDFDIRIDRLHVDRLRVEPGVSGKRQLATVRGEADIRDGRARMALDLASTQRDQLRLRLDVAPDRDRFDLDLRLDAPTQGLIGALTGIDRPLSAEISGAGSWSSWQGRAQASASGGRIVDLSLKARAGAYRLTGILAPPPRASGKLARLVATRTLVDGVARLEDRRLATRLSLRSDALAVGLSGTFDLGERAFDKVVLGAELLRPSALFPNMSGRDIKLRLSLDGPFESAAFTYRLSAPALAFDATGLIDVVAEGAGNLSPNPVAIPVRVSARQVTGIGNVAGGILRNLAVEGKLMLDPPSLSGQGLRLTSDKLKGELALSINLSNGTFEIGISGGLTRYLVPGIGLVDVRSELVVVPAPGGRGTRLEGRGHAWVRRLDNAFFRSLAGGLPEIHTRLVRGVDGVIHFHDLVLTAPDINLRGTGLRRRDGSFMFEGSGRQRRYGALTLALDGNISRPRLDIRLESPMDALGLSAVRLALDPTAEGYAWRAEGGSTLGAFTGRGQLLLAPQAPAVIAIDAVEVSGTQLSGRLRSEAGGFTGRLVAGGGGISGSLGFTPEAGVQKFVADLAFRRARLGGLADLRIAQGRLEGSLRADAAGPTIDARLTGRGLRRGQLRLERIAADLDLDRGAGELEATLSGTRGRAFNLKLAAAVAADRVSLTGQGQINNQPIRIERPAVIHREGAGWRLDPTRIAYAGGLAGLSGRLGKDSVETELSLERMPLAVLDLVAPDLGFGGTATGRLSYRLGRDGRLPVGEADLSIRGLTRTGLVLSSRPIDLALKARLTETMFGARAVASSEGRVVGRAQARISNLAAQGNVVTRLVRAPVAAQIRYAGPADTLWRLGRMETIDLSGPVRLSADIGGTLADPRIRGTIGSEAMRLESALTGTVIERIRASGRFDGSVLQIDQFTGATRGGGGVSGTGRFDLAAVNGFGMDLSIRADEAQLINRDDIGATITGPLTIRSDGAGGAISGDVRVLRSRYRLGQAAAVEVPRLNVTELNRPGQEEEDERQAKPWLMDIEADVPNRMIVTGLGLDSEWRGRLVIRGRPESPAISGRLDIVRGGYEFAGRRFELDRGTIRFLGQSPPDPVLDIAASASIQGINATIRVTGTGLRPDIAFSSTPALPEDELLSRLLFGTSITNLSAPEALQLAAAVNSLQGSGDGLNPINAIRRAAKLDRLRILPADTATGQGTSIAAGKYIGRRTYVELITDGQGYSATRVEFQITRWLSILSSISTLGQQSANVRISKDY